MVWAKTLQSAIISINIKYHGTWFKKLQMLSITLAVLNIVVPGTGILVKVSNIVAPGANNGLAKITTNVYQCLWQ